MKEWSTDERREGLMAHARRVCSGDVNERVKEINHTFGDLVPLGDWICCARS